MHKKDYKGRCEKKTLTKSKEICRTYDPIQNKFADMLNDSPDIKEIRCNVLLDNFPEGEYTSDFDYALNKWRFNGERMHTKRQDIKANEYQTFRCIKSILVNHGISDWGIVTNAEE